MKTKTYIFNIGPNNNTWSAQIRVNARNIDAACAKFTKNHTNNMLWINLTANDILSIEEYA